MTEFSVVPALYRSHPLLRSGHLQTIAGALLSGRLPMQATRPIEIHVDDTERMVVHEEIGGNRAHGASLDRSTPLVILIHGLGGDHRSPYLRRIASRCRDKSLRVWRVDLRGSGEGLRLAWKPSHAGATADVFAVLSRAAEMYPLAPIFVCGFSLSGNILLKLLGEMAVGKHNCGEESPKLRAALAVCPPVDLSECSRNMDRFTRSIYTRYYVRMLRRLVEERSRIWPQWKAISGNNTFRTIREFDEAYIATLCGFSDAESYYRESSASNWVHHITIPTQLLVDQHDPIVTVESVLGAPWNAASTKLHLSRFGGHLGYLGMAKKQLLSRWMDDFVLRWVGEQLG